MIFSKRQTHAANWTACAAPWMMCLPTRSRARFCAKRLNVVLVGAPNVGKSSLLNALAGDEVAIVTDIAGTTRDAVRERILIDGVPVHIVDTAGLRETDDVVERIGIERSRKAVSEADVALVLVDPREARERQDTGDFGRVAAGVETHRNPQQIRFARTRGRRVRYGRGNRHRAVGENRMTAWTR